MRRRRAAPLPAPVAPRHDMFAARVAEHDRQHPGYAAAWRAFADVLLANGGDAVVPPLDPDPLVDLLRETGAVLRPPGVVRRPGAPSECHRNAIALWRGGETAAIGTGYALSADGLWRAHSWGLDDAGCVVETTVERVAYFGRAVDPEWFAAWADPAPEQPTAGR